MQAKRTEEVRFTMRMSPALATALADLAQRRGISQRKALASALATYLAMEARSRNARAKTKKRAVRR